MILIQWQDNNLAVTRLVLRGDVRDSYHRKLLALAQRNGLLIADETADPLPGDFWVGCHPIRGWGDANPNQVGWVSMIEVPIAVAALLAHQHLEAAVVTTKVERPLTNDQPLLLQFV